MSNGIDAATAKAQAAVSAASSASRDAEVAAQAAQQLVGRRPSDDTFQRSRALELAIQSLNYGRDTSNDGIIKTATAFAAFLAGSSDVG